MTEIEKLQKQLAAFRASEPVPTVEDKILVSKSELQAIIAEEVRKATTAVKEYTLDEALNLIFSQDDLAYFANPINFNRLPKFLLTESGKTSLTALFIQFKQHNEK